MKPQNMAKVLQIAYTCISVGVTLVLYDTLKGYAIRRQRASTQDEAKEVKDNKNNVTKCRVPRYVDN
ncbi:PREDICTED: uncharacterized protein LOC105564850 isoform X2 [Vollenhovia emeryi]|uniref:uncharacterized protein LOC105564850 isoform X2 n=1 Tax=Vollenhovia emeryi TaxID=411798 RepID=UPI0005F3856E|nr:PREDICTED: uncharacterized protein LOC105564850 isoform X2 [Vollenhovia emeryi]